MKCCNKDMIQVGHIDIPDFYFPRKSIIAVDLYFCESCQQIKLKYAPPREQTNYVTMPNKFQVPRAPDRKEGGPMNPTRFSGDSCDLEALIKDFDRRFDSTVEDPIAKLGNLIEPTLNTLEVNFKKYLNDLKIEQRLCDDCYVKIIDHIHSKISSYHSSNPKGTDE